MNYNIIRPKVEFLKENTVRILEKIGKIIQKTTVINVQIMMKFV